MASIFDRIRNKTQGLINTLDRDKVTPGFQLFSPRQPTSQPTSQPAPRPTPQQIPQPRFDFASLIDEAKQSPYGQLATKSQDFVQKANPLKALLSGVRTFITRPAAEITMSGAEAISKKPIQFSSQDPAGRLLFGDKPLKSYQEQARTGGKDFLTDVGVSEERAQKMIPYMATAGILADIVPPGLDDVVKKGAKEIVPKLLKTVKNVSKHDEIFLEPMRFFKKVMPEDLFTGFKKITLDKFSSLKASSADFKSAYLKGVKNLGKKFTKGGDYSRLTQEFSEGVKTIDEVIAEIGEQGAKEIVNANEFFRRSYDEIINLVNKNRAQKGLSLINKRQDYYRHMGESGLGGWLESVISGGSVGTDPISASIFKKRKGEKTVYDAVGGFINYLERAGRAGFTDLVAPDIKAFSKQLTKEGGGQQLTRYLDEYADNILGIRKDEGAIVNILDKLARQIRKSTVVGKISTAVSQGLNIPTAAWDMNPQNYIKGLVSGDAKAAMETSSFLKDRVFRTPLQLFKGKEKLVQGAGNLLHDADTIATKSIWKGYYTKAISEGIDDAVKYADDLTKLAVGGRGIGDMSKFQKTKLGQLLAPFTLEVQNNINKLRDIGGDKRYGVLAGIIATNYFVNNVLENKGQGFRPLVDPIQASVDAYELAVGSDEKERNRLHAVTRVMVEMPQMSPIAQSIVASDYPIVKTLADSSAEEFLPTSRELFGQDDPTRFSTRNLYNPFYHATNDITGNTPIDVILNVASKFAPGMQQGIKTTQGVKATAEGDVKSRKGNVLFETTKGIPAAIRRTAFGKWADPNAKELFDSDFRWGLTEKQTKIYDSLKSDKEKAQYFNKVTKSTESERRIESILEKDKRGIKASDVEESIFSSKTAASESIEERMSVYKELNKVLSDDTLPDEYKQSVLEASGASKEEADYYTLSVKDQDVRLQELLPKLDNMDTEDMVKFLMQGRRAVGGKQLISNGMVDYLYENDYIDKNAKEAIKALKYDEINNSFYFKKSFTSGSGGTGRGSKLTYKQALALFKIPIPKFSELKGFKGLLSQYVGTTSQTGREGETLLSEILNKPASQKSSGGNNLWF